LAQPLKYINFHGISFVFGSNGGVDKWATFKLMNLHEVLARYYTSLPLEEYDLIINNDF